MRTVNIREAKVQFSKLIEAVAQGEKIVIEMADSPVAMLLPVQDYKLTRKPGAMKGKIKMPWILTPICQVIFRLASKGDNSAT